MQISMDKYKTSQLGQALKKVYHGEMTVDDCVKEAETEITEIFSHRDDANGNGFYGDVVGKCPKCGKNLIRGRYNYCCENRENCDFKINFNILGCPIGKNQVTKILSDGISDKLNFTSKGGKNFTAALKLAPDCKLNFEF